MSWRTAEYLRGPSGGGSGSNPVHPPRILPSHQAADPNRPSVPWASRTINPTPPFSFQRTQCRELVITRKPSSRHSPHHVASGWGRAEGHHGGFCDALCRHSWYARMPVKSRYWIFFPTCGRPRFGQYMRQSNIPPPKPAQSIGLALPDLGGTFALPLFALLRVPLSAGEAGGGPRLVVTLWGSRASRTIRGGREEAVGVEVLDRVCLDEHGGKRASRRCGCAAVRLCGCAAVRLC